MKKLIFLMAALLMMSSAAFVYAEEAEAPPPPQMTKTYDSAEEILNDFVLDGYIYSKTDVVEVPISATESKDATVTKSARTRAELPSSIPYEDEEGFAGELERGAVDSSVNGYTTRTYTMTDTRYYYNLPSRDLANIPKSAVKSGVSMTLSGVEWINSTGADAGSTAVGAGFTCKASYSGSYSKKEPTGYTYYAVYNGEVKREYVERITYEVSYVGKKVPDEKKNEPEPFNSIIPIAAGASGTGGIAGILWFFFLKKNAFVYNLQNGAYALIGKLRVPATSPTVNLDKLSHKATTNAYKIQISKGLAAKLMGQDVTVTSKGSSMRHTIPTCEADYSFDITI